MGNQQETVSAFDMGWLLGIADGEGCFCLFAKRKGTWLSYEPTFKLVNTDNDIIEEFASILERLQLTYHIYDAHRIANQKAAKRLEINGLKRVKRFLDIVTQYSFAKGGQAKLLLEYCNIRLNLPPKTLTTQAEHQIYAMLRKR